MAHPANTGSRLNLREATLKDLDELLFIEEQAHHYPWSAETLRWCIIQPHIHCFVLHEQKNIIGFSAYEIVIDEASLLNIAVSPLLQSKGYGATLLKQSLLQLDEAIEKIFLEVRVSNIAAQKLYQRAGFIEYGKRKNYYPTDTGREDAQLFSLEMAPFRTAHTSNTNSH
ncbi:MAG: ribosomal protein S18-alanine N-acetyltransferase [Pseudomonadales bacterium]